MKTPLLHHFLDVSQAHWIGGVHAFWGPAQRTVDKAIAEIKHGLDCRSGLM